ncbi:MAG: M23 family metallopeptidase, partial [Candidatus Kaiserbacteria bacterium]|nr:M23 family metallopeptidase [Candidatus Kaiserbacteria bacterium]
GSIQYSAALKPAMNIDPSPDIGGGDITIVDDSALVPEEGPAGTIADIEKPKNATISTYIVREGDTVSSVAKLFNVSEDTIRWANDLSKGAPLTVGEQLTILPVTGVRYTVKQGDTLASIAKKYDADATEIGNANGVDDATLSAGTTIVIPDGEIAAPQSLPTQPAPVHHITPLAHNSDEPAHNVGPVGTSIQIGYYIAPLSHYIETQGIHGYNAVDLAAPVGTPIMAAASGHVIVAKSGGYNGGYGSYVVIQHDNGSQTLYGHMSKVSTYEGEDVQQGEVIGYVGVTGKSTGPHVHFEIRNGIRNPF